MTSPVSRRAHAKINLALSLGPPEPPDAPKPGWHPISTWMACISLWDDVSVSPLAPGAPREFRVAWAPDAPRPTPIDWTPEQDLASRAHAGLEAALGRALPARVEVRKRIPVGAGLGGGSSDAGATLLALRDALAPDTPDDVLHAVAAGLGSDVAFFVDDAGEAPRPALVEGFGERVERLPPVAADLVLVLPPYACETRAVYRAFDEVIGERDAARRRAWDLEHGEGRGRAPSPHHLRADLVRTRATRAKGTVEGRLLFNDLAPAAWRVEPRLGALVGELSRATRREAHVTGSGSALFIVTDRPEKTMEQVTRALPEGHVALAVRLV